MSGNKRPFQYNQNACESEQCDYIATDERGLAIHINACPHVQSSRECMIANAQRIHRTKRARLFRVSNTSTRPGANSESEDESGGSTLASQLIADSESLRDQSQTGAHNEALADNAAPTNLHYHASDSLQHPVARQLQIPLQQISNQNRVVDVLPQPPVATECSSSLVGEGTGVFDTLPDGFGVFRRYTAYPKTIPDLHCELADYSNQAYEDVGDVVASDADIARVIWPCPNVSVFLMQHWHWLDGGHKTKSSRDSLVDKVLLDPRFKLQDIRGVVWQDIDKQLEAKGSSGLSAGWNTATLELKVPCYQSRTSSHAEIFPVLDFHYRKLTDVMIEAFSFNDPKTFHYEPFELHCLVPAAGAPGEAPQSQRLYGEVYNSKAMLQLHKDIQNLPPEPGCNLPRVAAVMMFSSDGAQVAQFSTTNIHPVYCFFGNQSKYERCKPSSNTCFDIAHIPPLPSALDSFLNDLSENGKTIKNSATLAHLRRELMHEVWGKLLDDDFLEAWVHGCIIKCADGITRRVYPRILTYLADYPEKVLLSTIRNMGKCACPRCLMPKEKFQFVGQKNDLKYRANNPRLDDQERKRITESEWLSVYTKGKKVNSTHVEKLLASQSLVPTKNIFSLRLSRHGFDYHKMMVVDFMHDIELGVWKNVFTHLIRIVQSSSAQVESDFNARFQSVAPFGPSTINRFGNNVSEMKKLAARDYEDILQSCIPVFDGLLPEAISKRTTDLLFVLAHWHSLGKLRIHSDKTLRIFENTTQELCQELRAFARYTSEYSHLETRKEKEARQCHESKKLNKSKTQGQKSKKGFSLDTYKIHSIPDYLPAILEYGTTDSYSTQIGELQHRRIKGLFARTNKNDATPQITSMERIQGALRRMKEELDILYKPLLDSATGSSKVDRLQNSDGYSHCSIATNQKSFIHLPTWLIQFSNDPATRMFMPRLRRHLIHQIDASTHGSTTTDNNQSDYTFQIQYDRLYQHAILGLNYTSYDVRRCSDCIHPSADRQFVIVKSNDDAHPFYYARILGIYHANVCCGHENPFQRVEFVWVRWLAHERAWRSGWKAKRLDRVSYYIQEPDDPEESLPPFDFISPSQIVRAVHLIPVFSAGKTFDYLPEGSTIGHDVVGEGDWKFWYVMRFVDRDMMLRYHGEGIGHPGTAAKDMNQDEETHRRTAARQELEREDGAPAVEEVEDEDEDEEVMNANDAPTRNDRETGQEQSKDDNGEAEGDVDIPNESGEDEEGESEGDMESEESEYDEEYESEEDMFPSYPSY